MPHPIPAHPLSRMSNVVTFRLVPRFDQSQAMKILEKNQSLKGALNV